MQFMDRSKIFITTKLKFGMDETEQNIIDRFRKCLERMQTDYADALSIHAADNSQIVKHEGFHSAVEKLKAEGRVKHAGLSCHGPGEEGAESMESGSATLLFRAVPCQGFVGVIRLDNRLLGISRSKNEEEMGRRFDTILKTME